jgi:hypothetical protein
MTTACKPEPSYSASGLTGRTVTASTKAAWHRTLADYDRLVAFRFGTQEHLNEAIDILFSENDVKGAPFRPVGNETIFVPDEAKELLSAHFDSCQLDFKVEPVYRHSDLTGYQLANARKALHLNY